MSLEVISIGQFGVRLIVVPYDNEHQEYQKVELQLFDYESLSLSMGGEITSSTLSNLEITDFTYTIEDGLLSGEIGILPENAGYWSIKFSNAKWKLEGHT
ncbi:hypothetical protein [Vibrio sp. SCSIO 43136]|uniref:hypothetical protein n=1 Tax=Vibrio sp. SCSIO 43136 TaxID=2819101 RepID=UPI0020759712|nr:hypothetical protein [Vibrio sp. SCSIO 43136]USD66850.1 hypothetical protein J4N39_19555 [Vibrio sp. SCSIO 43136]